MTGQQKEEPKNEEDWRRELIESASEAAKARLKALEDSHSRIDEMFGSMGEEQRERLRKSLEDIQSPPFGIELPEVTRATEILQAQRERERLDAILRQPIPSPEVMELRELREKLDEMVATTKAALKAEEKAHKETRRWQIAFFVATVIGIVMTAISILIALWALRVSGG